MIAFCVFVCGGGSMAMAASDGQGQTYELQTGKAGASASSLKKQGYVRVTKTRGCVSRLVRLQPALAVHVVSAVFANEGMKAI